MYWCCIHTMASVGKIRAKDRKHGHAYKSKTGTWIIWDAKSGKVRCPAHHRLTIRCAPCSRARCPVHALASIDCHSCKTPTKQSAVHRHCALHADNGKCSACNALQAELRKAKPATPEVYMQRNNVRMCKWHKTNVYSNCRRCRANFKRPCKKHLLEINTCSKCA